EVAPVGKPSVEDVAVPTGADDPVFVRMIARVFGNAFTVGLISVDIVEVAVDKVDAAEYRMSMRVMEGRYQRPAVQLDHLGVGVSHAVAGSDTEGDDQPVGNRYAVGCRICGINCVDFPASVDAISTGHGRSFVFAVGCCGQLCLYAG